MPEDSPCFHVHKPITNQSRQSSRSLLTGPIRNRQPYGPCGVFLAWDLIVPSHDDVLSGARSLRGAGYRFDETERGVRVADPWGTAVYLRARDLELMQTLDSLLTWSFVQTPGADAVTRVGPPGRTSSGQSTVRVARVSSSADSGATWS
jgi:hypothetical protein